VDCYWLPSFTGIKRVLQDETLLQLVFFQLILLWFAYLFSILQFFDMLNWDFSDFLYVFHLIQCYRPGVYNLFAIGSHIAFICMKYGRQWVRVIFMRYYCCNLSGGVALIVWFTTSGMCAKSKNICVWSEQTIIEWSGWSDLGKWPLIMLVNLVNS